MSYPVHFKEWSLDESLLAVAKMFGGIYQVFELVNICGGHKILELNALYYNFALQIVELLYEIQWQSYKLQLEKYEKQFHKRAFEINKVWRMLGRLFGKY